jgi:predicted DNA-binding transcriptional regulator AlpA
MSTTEQTSRVPHFLRQKDLEARGISASVTQTRALQKDQGFPAGRMISPKIRAWTEDEVAAWLSTRPIKSDWTIPRRPVGRPRKNLQAPPYTR